MELLQWLPLSCGMGYCCRKLTFSPRLSDLGETNAVFVCQLHVFVKFIFWILLLFIYVKHFGQLRWL